MRRTHQDHHKAFSDAVLDLEQQVDAEIRLFDGHPLLRFIWVACYEWIVLVRVAYYGKRPMGLEHVLSLVTVLLFDLAGIYYFGPHFIGYFWLSTWCAVGFGLTGLWGIATHTLFFGEVFV